jgi:hypothetical protein
LDKEIFDTCHGLSKIPYMRDTRRSVGIDDFELEIEDISGNFENKSEGVKFKDRISLGSYNTDIHGLIICEYPDSVEGNLDKKYPPLPFYIPFRFTVL